MLRVIAIDWSGSKTQARRKIWAAEAHDGELAALRDGRDRGEIGRYLLDAASRDRELMVGLDFAFSFPAWHLREQGFADVRALWTAAAVDGDAWLAACRPPFWGRPGRRRPPGEGLRRCDRELPAVAGIRPKSPFQIGGAGAVGTGSVRGMALLHELAGHGFAVWPFDVPGAVTVVEIYPRVCTGAVNKSDARARGELLDRRYRDRMTPYMLRVAASCEDAFDAAVSALVMWDHRAELRALRRASDPEVLLEGAIWAPA